MENVFAKENEYCMKCNVYNLLIKDSHIKKIKDKAVLNKEGFILNTSLGLSLIIEDIIENTKGQHPNCATDICNAVINIYDTQRLKKMKKAFDLTQKGKYGNAKKELMGLAEEYNMNKNK